MTAETTPTPGPWHVEERSSYYGVYSGISMGNGWGRPFLIAGCAKPHDHALANAELIASAITLIPALRRQIEMLTLELAVARDALARELADG